MEAYLFGAYVSGFLNAATGMGAEDTAVFISHFTEVFCVKNLRDG